MKLFCSIFLTIAAIVGCAKKKADTPHTAVMTPKDTTKTVAVDSLNYLALGDSYTIGEAVPDTQAYPCQLVAQMNAQKLAVKKPAIIAVTGWTTDNLIYAINQSGLVGKHYDLVTLLIGVNDQYQGLSQDNYKVKFQQVLNTAIAFANGDKTKVFVLSIPDYGVTPFAGGNDSTIGPQIDQFNAINKSISLAAGVNYLDITAISRQAAIEPDLIANDGLHPSGKMYGLWIKQLAPMVVKALGIGR
ncbi:MAG TPA: SGNH/GDSL hydrolase family protein [Puia sp.]|nr:SGNH/GDSL hydrolase family protein [Puia sp.]